MSNGFKVTPPPHTQNAINKPTWGVLVAEHTEWSDNLHTGNIHRYKDHALLRVGLCLRVRLSHEDAQLALGVHGSCNVSMSIKYNFVRHNEATWKPAQTSSA